MPFVSRSDDGAIDGIFEQLQEGTAEEFLVDDNPELVARLNASPKVSSVSARQFRLMLRRAGLLDQVKAWVAQQDGETQDAFEYSGTFVKDSQMMAAGFAALGFTVSAVDAFFLAASKL
ncbi:hypothetical protein J3P71_17710 [Rhizobium leguminosarum]|uniref:hypothetical protein n=1 Tax=Rhizobium leguminosarum TaxID=384 RepID=UPI0014414BD5|nr:hypothetical protein [Rhizobium leguminosarum]MBY5838069.1 hypothetical protein [Rhizobium leguminosarum]NKM82242.1 hypothetical protein [Rhizobium leguminosarum bv. viciae]QSZ06706.1 hypothetical protein J3P71_17710 [Rhizobium leguminosarum]